MTSAEKQVVRDQMDEAIAKNIADGTEIPDDLQAKYEQVAKDDFPDLAKEFGIV